MKLVDKPWGFEQIFAVNKQATVKMLYLYDQEMTSYQYHASRDEEILVVKGILKVYYKEEGEEKIVLLTQQSQPMLIPRHIPHRFEGVKDDTDDVTWVLEISTGIYSEDDIVRLEDKYGRGGYVDADNTYVVKK